MRARTCRTVLCFAFVFCVAAFASAAEEVEVAAVRFLNVRPAGGSADPWLEADVQLNVSPRSSGSGRFVNRVRVALTVGIELPARAGEERRTEYYRAEAECVALESGRADVRFYFGPELVKRDQLHGEPKFWGVELTAAGRALSPAHGAYVPALATADARKNFQTRAAAGFAANSGLLQPQYLTPFALDYPRATPTFVRSEASLAK